MRRIAFALACLALCALPARAQTMNEQMLVSPDWLRSRLAGVTLLHVSSAEEYDAGHIPGAVLVDTSSLLLQRDVAPNELPPVATLERAFRAAGVRTRERIVVYGNDPVAAARAWFTLDTLGHGGRTSLLDGGFANWVASGYPYSTTRERPKSGTFEARPVPNAVTRLSTMREVVRLRELLGPSLVLIDARSYAQYCGEEAGPHVREPGHIPGAVSVPYMTNLDVTGAFRSADELRSMYRRAGVTRNSANIVYCRTGMQASITYFVLRYLGYDVSLYDGSFSEWSNSGETIGS
jgi:thiosulfate/3-mercaptopyruvate sulfurtransferase